ncbi:MAG: osmotically inducible protein OsmC [Gammaproteobacteria bacterium]|nr:osmotically inducible protein OsmC [Gammaproteobacteria bacterium]
MTTKAHLKWVDNERFLAKSGDSPTYVVDGSDENGAICPMQMLLISAAGCTAIDVIGILTKKQVHLTEFEVNITGEEAQPLPQRYTQLSVEYVFYGRNIPSKAVEQAIRLSETKYCCVMATLNVKAEHSYKIIES